MKAQSRFFDWPSTPALLYTEKATQNLTGGTTVLAGGYVKSLGSSDVLNQPWAVLDTSKFLSFFDDIMVNPPEQSWQLEEQFRAAFGYTQKVSELCQRLEKIEVTLLDVVKKLDLSTHPQRALWVPIESFAPEPFEILKPITAVVTPVEDGFEAGLFDANLFSTGDTEVEAVNNLKSVILETYAAFEQLGDSKLGPGPLQQRRVLTTLIRKAES